MYFYVSIVLFLFHESEVAQSCLTVCNPMDCNLSGSSVHGIFQAIALEWIAISFSSGSSRPRDRTQVSRIVDRRFTVWTTREVHLDYKTYPISELLKCEKRGILELMKYHTIFNIIAHKLSNFV